MSNVQGKILALALVAVSCPAGAQDKSVVGKQAGPNPGTRGMPDSSVRASANLPESVVVVEGPYTLKDSFNVYGYVIERNSPKVKFQPCTGEAIEVEEELLVSAAAGCEGEAPDDGNPVTVSCADVPSAWGKATRSIVSDVTSDKIGSVYFPDSDGEFTQTVPDDVSQTIARFAKVHSIHSCGAVLFGLGGNGAPITGIVAIEPTQGFD